MTAVSNILDLVGGDNPVNDGRPPVVVRGNQSSRAVMELQGRISQWIGNTVLSELRANRANNHPLRLSPLHDKAADRHVVACLNKGARTDIGQPRRRSRRAVSAARVEIGRGKTVANSAPDD